MREHQTCGKASRFPQQRSYNRVRQGELASYAIVASVFLFLSLLLIPASALYAEEHSGLGPVIPKAKGEQCVEPTEVMRRRHHEFILHQRDDTVIEGIRTKQYRFTRCIDCHVQPTAAGEYPRHSDANHFCTACHRYSSVSIDCFQCHADRPAQAYTTIKSKPQSDLKALSDMKQRQSGLSLQFIQKHLSSNEETSSNEQTNGKGQVSGNEQTNVNER